MRPKVYYHLFQAEGDVSGGWRFLWHEAMIALMDSGLSEAADCNLVLVGSDKQRSFVTTPTTEPLPWISKYPFLALREETGLEANEGFWENRTIQLLWRDAKAHHIEPSGEPYPILYFHSKGALTENLAVHGWRNMMTAFCVEDWRRCVDVLTGAYGPHTRIMDTCGVDFKPFGGPHYSGNFWWARSDFIASLPDPQERSGWTGEPRMWSEYWLCHKGGRHFPLWDSGIDDLYRTFVPRSRYVHALREPRDFVLYKG